MLLLSSVFFSKRLIFQPHEFEDIREEDLEMREVSPRHAVRCVAEINVEFNLKIQMQQIHLILEGSYSLIFLSNSDIESILHQLT